MRGLEYEKDALRALRKLPAATRSDIRKKLDAYLSDPASISGSVKKLSGSPYVRIRVGDYRVILDDQRQVVIVVQVGHRREIYR